MSSGRLQDFINRIEKVEDELSGIKNDRKDIYLELKGEGYDVKTVRKIVRLRKIDALTRQQEEELLDLYKAQVGL